MLFRAAQTAVRWIVSSGTGRGLCSSAASPPGPRHCHALQTNWLPQRSCRLLLSGLRCLWGKPWDGEGVLYCSFMHSPVGPAQLLRGTCLPFRRPGQPPSSVSVPMEGHVSLAAVGCRTGHGRLLPPRHFLQLHVTIFFLSEFHSYFPFRQVRFLSVLFVPTAQIGLRRGTARACRVRSCGWVPGARLHHQQITRSPQPVRLL